MATLQETFEYLKQNPEDPRGEKVFRAMMNGDLDQRAINEGIDLSVYKQRATGEQPQPIEQPQEQEGFLKRTVGAEVKETGERLSKSFERAETPIEKGLVGATIPLRGAGATARAGGRVLAEPISGLVKKARELLPQNKLIKETSIEGTETAEKILSGLKQIKGLVAPEIYQSIVDSVEVGLWAIGGKPTVAGVKGGVKGIAKVGGEGVEAVSQLPEKFVTKVKGVLPNEQKLINRELEEFITSKKSVSNKVSELGGRGVDVGKQLSDPTIFRGIKVKDGAVIPDEAIATIQTRIDTVLDAKKKILPEIDRLVPETTKDVWRNNTLKYVQGTPADKAQIIKKIEAQLEPLPDTLSATKVDGLRALFRKSSRDAKQRLKEGSHYSALEQGFRDTVFDIADNLPAGSIKSNYIGLNTFVRDMIETQNLLNKQIRGMKVKGGRLTNLLGRGVGAVVGSKGGIFGAIAGSEAGGLIANIIVNNQLGNSFKLKLIRNITDDPKILREVEKILGELQKTTPPLLPPARDEFRTVIRTGKSIRLPSKTPSETGVAPGVIEKEQFRRGFEAEVTRKVPMLQKPTSKAEGQTIKLPKETTSSIEARERTQLKRPTGISPVKKGETPKTKLLVEEAKKFKSADEFVKAQGEPVYHGTNAKFTEFDKKTIGKNRGSSLGEGFYFTKDKDFAKQHGKNVIETRVYLQNPLILNSKNDIHKIYNLFGGKEQYFKKLEENIISKKDITKELKKQGFDGIIDNWSKGEVVVFEPNQIKTKSQLKEIWDKANKN
jgi:hypothetical protein